HKQARAPFIFEDLTGLDPTQQAQRAVDWIEAEKRRPFDRTSPPLVRFHAQMHSATSFQFIFSFHHSCLDGWSLAAVMTELFQEYSALLRGVDDPLPAPRAVYRDFIALEMKTVGDEVARSFWKEQVKDATLHLVPRWPKSFCAGGLEQVRGPEVLIEANVFAGLRRLAQEASVPLKSVLLAAHQRVMSELYGTKDVISALISNGRPEVLDGERMIGLFLNAVPLRMRLEGGTWLDLARAAFAAEQRILPHRRFPLAEIQKLNGGRPLSETAFDFVHFHVYRSLEGKQDFELREGPYFEANDMTTYTTFMLDMTSTSLELHIDYDPGNIARRQVEEMTQYYVATLYSMAENPGGRYEQFSPLPHAERQQILVEWNQTAEDYPREVCLHDLFASQAKARSEGLALICGQDRLTFAELERRADAFRAKLHSMGLKKGGLVGIHLERTPDMIAALLGVLKAGGAYVPLDPSFPKSRLEFMARDAGLTILISSRMHLADASQVEAALLLVEDVDA
ncbi:non-ribosomal peptide synthetase, partial [bacterium]|nr:non-ribosomal peptide synthetase [bacterium]